MDNKVYEVLSILTKYEWRPAHFIFWSAAVSDTSHAPGGRPGHDALIWKGDRQRKAEQIMSAGLWSRINQYLERVEV